MARAVQTFEVSLKAFIVRDGLALFVRESDTGYWELPGGRIDVGEEWDQQETVLCREIREELGAEFQVKFDAGAVTWMRQRPTDGAFLFIVGRVGRSVEGVPQLSGEHDRLAWLGLQDALALGFPENSNYRDAIERLWRVAFPGAAE